MESVEFGLSGKEMKKKVLFCIEVEVWSDRDGDKEGKTRMNLCKDCSLGLRKASRGAERSRC